MTRLLFFIQLPICRRWSYLISETSKDNYGEQIGGRVRSKPVGDMQKISPHLRIPASPCQSQPTTYDHTLGGMSIRLITYQGLPIIVKAPQ